MTVDYSEISSNREQRIVNDQLQFYLQIMSVAEQGTCQNPRIRCLSWILSHAHGNAALRHVS